MVYENKWLGTGTVGNAANTLDLVNAPGPGKFTNVSTTVGKWGTTPDGYNALEIDVSASGKQRLDNTLAAANQSGQFSISEMFATSALPASGSSNNLQIMSAMGISGSTQFTLAGLNITSSGAVGLSVSNGTTPAYPSTGITIAAGKTYRFNMWGSIGTSTSNGTVSVAVYDVKAGTQVGSTYTYTGDLGGAVSGNTIVAFFAGKVDGGNQSGLQLFYTSIIEATGVAKDYGASPDMSVSKAPTAPTVTNFPNIDADYGDRVQVHARVIPTTSGATATSISLSLVSITSKRTGAPVNSSSSNTISWGDPAVTSFTSHGVVFTIDKNFVREATMPKVGDTLVYTYKIVGLDSTGLTGTTQFTLTLFSNDIF